MFKVLGLTDSVTDCDCCGKRGLKCTVALESEHGGVVYYGRDCAGMALYGRKSAANTRRVESVAREADYAREATRRNKLARVAQDRNRANYLYACTRLPLDWSAFLYRGTEVVRAQSGDDMAFYISEGFSPK